MKSIIKVLKNKKIIFLLLSLLFIAGIAVSIKSLSSPAEGTITDSSQLNSAEKAPEERKRIYGSIISFSHPARYEEVAKTKDSASLEHWTLYGRQSLGIGPSAQIGIAVMNLPAGGVKEDGSYKLYASRPQTYKLTTLKKGSDELIISTRTEGEYTYVVLWPHDKYLLSIALSSNQQNTQLESEINGIVESVDWL